MKDIEAFRQDIVDPDGARLKEFQKKFKEAEEEANKGDDMVMTSMGFWKSKKEIEREEEMARQKKEKAQKLAEFRANRMALENAEREKSVNSKKRTKGQTETEKNSEIVGQ